MRIEDGRLSFFQWDINQRLLIDNENIKEVHFSNAFTQYALVCEVFVENGKRLVNVPNILLQTEWTIKAYGWCDNCVKAAESYVVQAREKPEDYIYTETEVKRFDDLEARLETVENKVEATENKAAATENKVEAVEDRVEVLEKNSGNKYKLMGTVTVTSSTKTKTITSVGGKPVNYKKVFVYGEIVKGSGGSSTTSTSAKLTFGFTTLDDIYITLSGAISTSSERSFTAECKGSDELYKTEYTTATSSGRTTQRQIYTLCNPIISDEAIKSITFESLSSTVLIPSGSKFYIYAVEAD